MNLPNKLTVLRVVLVPIFVLLFYVEAIPFHNLLAMVVFVAASITDALDGHLARKHNLVTNFGKFLDPLADKVLVMTALACFVDDQLMGAVPFLIIMTREFMVSGLRLVVANSGVVVPAGFLGKLKTAFTMTVIIAILVNLSFIHDFDYFGFDFPDLATKIIDIVLQCLIWVSTVLTVISGVTYLKAYWKFINPEE